VKHLHKSLSYPVWLALILPIAILSCSAGSGSPFRTLDNTPFATRCDGPQGALLAPARAPGQVSVQAASTVLAAQHSVAALRRAEHSLQLLQSAGLKSPAAEVRFPRMMYRLDGGRLHLPDLMSAQQGALSLGDPTNDITFQFQGFSASDQAALEAYLQSTYPKMRLVYGPPAFDLTVTIVQDDTIHSLQGGIYDVSTNEIRIPPLSGNFPEDTFVLCMLALHAFRDDVALFYDAWEDGMTGAAATAIQTMPGVVSGYDPVDPGPFYCWSVYECENQPALANNTFYPPSGFAGMLVWRVAMARAAWLKCWAEDDRFFSDFNQAYYSAFTDGLQGDVPGLKDLATQVLPSVEGMSFYAWLERQYVLDTSIHTGLKLYTWNIPLEQAVALIAEHYLTGLDGDESPRGGVGRTIYWNYDFTLSLYSEEGNVINIPASGAGAGEGFLIPTFYNIGGAQRLTVQLDLNGLRGQYPYPYRVRGFDPGQNDFYGGVLGGPSATLEVEGDFPQADINATRGVWGTSLTGDRLSPGQITVTITNPQGQEVRRTINVGWDSYVAFLPGGGQAGLTHTFYRPGNGVLLISLPVEPLEAEAAAVLGIDPGLLLARWDPSALPNGAYQIWPAIDPFAPGRGFWIKLFDNVTVDLEGVLPPEDRDYPVSVPLGWNQVGSPRRQAVAIADLEVQVGTAQLISFTEAVNRGYLQQGFYRYVLGVGYEITDTISPFEGYWVRCLLPGGLRIIFPAL